MNENERNQPNRQPQAGSRQPEQPMQGDDRTPKTGHSGTQVEQQGGEADSDGAWGGEYGGGAADQQAQHGGQHQQNSTGQGKAGAETGDRNRQQN